MDGATAIGTGALNGSGVATITPTVALSVGTHPITASYGGNSTYASSSSGTALSEVVNKAATTTGTPASTVNPATAGLAVTLSATVTGSTPGVGTPTGSVTVSEGATRSGERRVGEGGG